MNYQPVLSNVYFDTGLKQIASASGSRGETMTSLQRCSHFKKIRFLIQSWEAIYLLMLGCYSSAEPLDGLVYTNFHWTGFQGYATNSQPS